MLFAEFRVQGGGDLKSQWEPTWWGGCSGAEVKTPGLCSNGQQRGGVCVVMPPGEGQHWAVPGSVMVPRRGWVDCGWAMSEETHCLLPGLWPLCTGLLSLWSRDVWVLCLWCKADRTFAGRGAPASEPSASALSRLPLLSPCEGSHQGHPPSSARSLSPSPQQSPTDSCPPISLSPGTCFYTLLVLILEKTKNHKKFFYGNIVDIQCGGSVRCTAKWFSYVCVVVLVTQLCPTLCDPMDCNPPGSLVQGTFWARILEWVVIPFSRGSSQSRDWTQVSCIAGRFFTVGATREALCVCVCVCIHTYIYMYMYIYVLCCA